MAAALGERVGRRYRLALVPSTLADGLRKSCGFRPLWNGICDAPELLRTPGYPVFLELVGERPRAIVAIQAAMGASVCLLVALFLNRRFGARVAIFSALLIAIDPEAIAASKEVLTDQPFQLMIVAGVLCAMWAAGCESPKRAAALALSSGIIVGVATLVRPVGELVITLLALPFLLKAEIKVPRRILLTTVAVLGALGVIGPWIVRDGQVAGVWTLTTEDPMNLVFLRGAWSFSTS